MTVMLEIVTLINGRRLGQPEPVTDLGHARYLLRDWADTMLGVGDPAEDVALIEVAKRQAETAGVGTALRLPMGSELRLVQR